MKRRALIWIAAGTVVAYALGLGLLGEDPGPGSDTRSTKPTSAAPSLAVRAPSLAVRAPAAPEAPPAVQAEIVGHVWRAGKRVDARVSIARILPNEMRAWALAAALEEPDATVPCTGVDGYRVGASAYGSHVVRATAVDGTVSVMATTSIAAGTMTHRVDLQLPGGEHTLRVRVLDTQGEPATADVFLRGIALTGFKYGSAISGPQVTDADGRVEFGGLGEGGARLTAHVGGLSVTTAPVAVPRTDPVEIVLPSFDRMISIKIVDEDTRKPVVGGVLRVEGRTPQGTHWAHEVAFSEGATTFGVAATALSVTGKAPGYADRVVHAVADVSKLTIRLTRRPRLSGYVVRSDTGASVPGVRVSYLSLWRGELRFQLSEPAPFVVTDADGAFVIDVDSWSRWMLWVQDKGLVSDGLAETTMTLNPCVVDGSLAPLTGIRLRVGPAAHLHGRITRGDGSPAAGASVYVDQERLKEEAPESSSFEMMMLYMRPTSFATETTTDADGRYRFENLVPGWRWQGMASLEGSAIKPEIDVTLKAGANPPLDMTATPAASKKGGVDAEEAPKTKALVVLVTDTSGEPLPGATVSFRGAGWGNHSLPPPIRTGPDGRVVVEAAPRQHLIVFADAPSHTSERGVRIGNDEESATIVMRLGAFVTGTVHHADGIPATGAAITAKATGGGSLRGLGMRHAEVVDAAWTPDGGFRAGPLAEGRFEIEATLTLGGVAYVGSDETESGGNVRIVLQRQDRPDPEAGRLGMLVVRGTGGEPLGRATMHDYSLAGGKNGWPTMWGMSNGMREMPDDDYPFWVDLARPHWPNGRAAPFGELRLGPYKAGEGPEELEVRLPPERTIEGRVVLPDGTPGIGRLVEAFTAPPAGLTSDQTWISSNAFADSRGQFRLRQLGDLDYDIVVRASPGMSRVSVRASAGARGVTIKMHATVSPRIVVVDEGGRAVEGAEVIVTNGEDPARYFRLDRSVARGTTDKDGAVVLADLDPRKTYRLTCDPPRSSTTLRTWAAISWTPVDLEVVLAPGHPVVGSIVDGDGNPIRGVEVSIRGVGEAEDFTSRKTSSKGTFQLARIPPGVHRLKLWRTGMRREGWTRTVQVPAAEPLDLVLAEGHTLDVDVGEALAGARYVTVRLLALSDTPSESEGEWATSTRAGGSVRFFGLRRDLRYALFASVSHEGRHLAAWIPELPEGASKVSVPWAAARATRIIFEGPEAALAAWKTVSITEPRLHYQQRTKEGALTMHLPEGVWGLSCQVGSGAVRYEGTGRVTAGETSTLVLRVLPP